MRLRRPRAAPADDGTRVAWQCASLLLAYPDEHLPQRLELVDRVCPAAPPPAQELLRDCVAAHRGIGLVDLAMDYVETFDTTGRNSLYLTYFAHGDTRKRGMALLRFASAYRAGGMTLTADELPDHLCVVLEYGATVDLDTGRELLTDHRPGLELLRLSLTESRSRWAGAVAAVSATLPALQGEQTAAIRRLAAQGPPAEEVGLTPYGTPAFDAAVNERRAVVDLPMPGVRGA